MATDKTAIRYTDFSGLMNPGSSYFVMRDNELYTCKNCYRYKNGLLEKVPGYEKEDLNQFVSTRPVSFMHYYYDSANDDNYLICGSKDSADTNYTVRYIENLGGTTSSGYQSFTLSPNTANDNFLKNSVMSAQTYLGKTFVSGYAGNQYPFDVDLFTISGTTLTKSAIDDTDLSNAPESGRYLVRYRDLLYMLNCVESAVDYPTRAYFCDTPVGGAITWSNSTNFIDVGQEDGDVITGGAVAYDRLVVFKRNSMWTYDESELKQVADVGCVEHRTIQRVYSRLYWFDGTHIYMWNGGEPINISERIKPFLDRVDKSDYDSAIDRPYKVFATKYRDEYRLYVGNVTYRGEEYDNAWVCYDTVDDTFYIRSTHHTAHCATNIIGNDNKVRTDFGGNSGYTYFFANREDETYEDDGEPIDSFFVTRDLDFGTPELRKFNSNIAFFTKNPQGMNVSVAYDGGDYYDGSTLPVLSRNIEKGILEDEANLFRLKFTENSGNKSWQFYGFAVDTKLREDQIND